LIVVVGGTYLEQIQGSETEHGPGHMLSYQAFTTHSRRFGSTGTRKLVFTPDAASFEYLRSHGISVDTARYVGSPVISRLAHRAMAEMEKDDSFTPLAVKCLLLELVAP